MMPRLFGKYSIDIIGFGFTFVGVSSLISSALVHSFYNDLGFGFFIYGAACLNGISLLLLLLVFTEEPVAFPST